MDGDEMKKTSVILLIIISLLVTGCGAKKEVVYSNGKKVNTAKMGHKKCSRQATGGTGVDVNLDYDIYYKGEELTLVKSVEQVISADSSKLDEYEDAYKKIYEHYDGLEYFDAYVDRGDTSVTSNITINYEKIDTDALLKIEGEEDNIFEDNKPKLSKYLSLIKKMGITCSESTN